MLIVMRRGAPQEDIDRVVAVIEEMGYQARPMPGRQRTTVGLVGNDGRVDGSRLEAAGQALEDVGDLGHGRALLPGTFRPSRASDPSTARAAHAARARGNLG